MIRIFKYFQIKMSTSSHNWLHSFFQSLLFNTFTPKIFTRDWLAHFASLFRVNIAGTYNMTSLASPPFSLEVSCWNSFFLNWGQIPNFPVGKKCIAQNLWSKIQFLQLNIFFKKSWSWGITLYIALPEIGSELEILKEKKKSIIQNELFQWF